MYDDSLRLVSYSALWVIDPLGATTHLVHLCTHTASLVSSLTSLSEHTQVNGVATTDAGCRNRSLKNKLGGWRTD